MLNSNIMKMKKYLIVKISWAIYILVFSAQLHAQPMDSLQVFTEAAYLDWVKEYHPIIQRANLLQRAAEAYQLKARGGFEPKVEGSIQQKSFDGKTYFTIGQTGLKIPTWLGAEVKAGYHWTNGVFLNPENNLPTNGQAFVGVNWSLGRGLRIDERRATLKKARLLEEANEAERQQQVNNLLLEAGKAYWEWVYAYNSMQIQEEGLRLSSIRLEGVRGSFLQGDKPAIDTLESLIQVQNREIALNEAMVQYDNQSRILSNFLWYENELPLEVSDLLRPPNYEEIDLSNVRLNLTQLLDQLPEDHPTLQAYRVKLAQLEIDRRLKAEQLKPQIDVELNLLSDGFDFVNTPKDFEGGNFNALLTENYKAGINVSMPIFNRKTRGDLELVDLKLLETNYLLRQKSQDIKNKILNYQGVLDNTKQQIVINQSTIDNYQILLDAENEKFRFGESSIFLLNSREQKLIESQLKLIKLLTLYRKNRLALLWATGSVQ